MAVRIWRFITLVLAALALTMESAHLLELPQKLNYDPEMYAAVNSTLYLYFAIIGGFYQVSSIVAALVLAYLVRHRGRTAGWTAAGAASLVIAFCLWLGVVNPVNQEVAAAAASAPDTVPALWTQLRGRWEYGHVAGFISMLTGFAGLIVSVLVETPEAPVTRPS